MAAEPNSEQSTTDVHIAPWASKWDALPESVESAAPPVARADAVKIPTPPNHANAQPGGVLFASKVMAGISALSFVLLALLVVACWPDIARVVG